MALSTLQNDSCPRCKASWNTIKVNSLPVAFVVSFPAPHHGFYNALSPAKHDSKPPFYKVTDLLMGINLGLN